MNGVSALFILIIGVVGAVAGYSADIIGRKIGKSRRSLPGLRPRHTAALMSALAGLLIPWATIGVLYALSSDVRVWIREGRQAIIERDKARNELFQVQSQRDQQKDELARSQRDLMVADSELAKKQADLKKANGDLASVNGKLIKVQSQYAAKQRELSALKGTYAGLKTTFAALDQKYALLKKNYDWITKDYNKINEESLRLQNEIGNLTHQRDDIVKRRDALQSQYDLLRKQFDEADRQFAKEIDSKRKELEKVTGDLEGSRLDLDAAKVNISQLQGNINELVRQRQALMNSFEASRRQPIMFQAGFELARQPVAPGLKADMAKSLFLSLVRDARSMAKERGAETTAGQEGVAGLIPRNTGAETVSIDEQERQIVAGVTNSNQNMVLIARSFWNAFVGEYVPLDVETLPNPLIYTRFARIAEATIDGGTTEDLIVSQIQDFIVNKLSKKAVDDGMIPAIGKESPLGQVSREALLALVREIADSHRKVRVLAVASDDTRAADPLRLEFRLR